MTREVVLARVEEPPFRFFEDADERRTLKAFCDVVTAQDGEPRIPVLGMIDAKFSAGQLDGYQYAGMPDDRDLWRIVARGLDEVASGFAEATPETQREIVKRFSKGELKGEAWQSLDVSKAWKVVTRAILAAFYSHPWAWNEIGFGGPAYPRGYAALGVGKMEGWEPKPAFDLDPVKDVRERGLE
ncbi:MAG TPA: gluconate 2-dehydrogenase subunit 3 family protein [Thermoleophilaceae bacterium]